ncbi:hypothetical protein BLNAU_12026 [Blattamonas nauphoetae]|uniref:Uncharacterized protein n=1 Tax=Blattamonas nauphoetae TaxID=2049346 RepID=A0ABQ9XQT7_9EUKA|nr:hypothetical protein BLNAU_12026 [Blattamonas nauphoetae]
MAVAGSVGKASRKEELEREPANADGPPLVRLAIRSRVSHKSHSHRVAEGNESKKLENGDHISPPVSTATDEARTGLLLANLRGRSTSEPDGVQKDQQNTDTAHFAACHVVSTVTAIRTRRT